MIVFMHTSYDVFDLVGSGRPDQFNKAEMELSIPESLNMERGVQKPMGGLWGSPVNDPESAVIWEKFVMENLADKLKGEFEWLSDEEFEEIKQNPSIRANDIKECVSDMRRNSFYYAVDETKLFFPSKSEISPYMQEKTDCIGRQVNIMDFDKMRSEGYSGLYYYEKKDVQQFVRYFGTDHWDVDSSVVWDPQAVVEIDQEIAALAKLTEGTLTPFDAFDPKTDPIYVYNWIKTNRNKVADAIDQGILNREKVNQFLIDRKEPKYKVDPNIAIHKIISKAVEYAEDARAYNQAQIPICQYCIDNNLEIAAFSLPKINRKEEGVYVKVPGKDTFTVKPLSDCKPGDKIMATRGIKGKNKETAISNITKVNGITVIELSNHTAIVNSYCEDVYQRMKNKALEIEFTEFER